MVPQKNTIITTTRKTLFDASAGSKTYARLAAMNDSTVGNHATFSE